MGALSLNMEKNALRETALAPNSVNKTKMKFNKNLLPFIDKDNYWLLVLLNHHLNETIKLLTSIVFLCCEHEWNQDKGNLLL